LRKSGVYQPQSGWLKFMLILLLANSALAAISVWLMGAPGDWLTWETMQRIGWLALLVGSGVVVYFAVMIAAGLRLRHLRGELF